jgi:hypothetical protein
MSHTNHGLQFTPRSVVSLPEGASKGEVYFHVNFYIDTIGYRNGNDIGFKNDLDRESFYSLSKELLIQLGFEDRGESTKVFIGDHGYLHIHPDSFSGVVPEGLLHPIFNSITGLDAGGRISGRWADVYEGYELVSESEVGKRISSSLSEIEAAMVESLKTKNKNKYKSIPQYSSLIYQLDGFRFVKESNSDYSFNGSKLGVHFDFVESKIKQIFESLVAKGFIKVLVQDSISYYRSANATEMKPILAKLNKKETKLSGEAVFSLQG